RCVFNFETQLFLSSYPTRRSSARAFPKHSHPSQHGSWNPTRQAKETTSDSAYLKFDMRSSRNAQLSVSSKLAPIPNQTHIPKAT
ncbi:hypothetical protein ACHAXS_014357, partial [Conticribra weissflogii]